eukprot:CAMPEP_0201513142 /NCGR_PEP_ID=MMETSP0161_2-20130828/5248_1 /ASSEMBLY_ACC=CAM_ASM_000251 /TAXON_ID=180227 /ORGANISM="Neoparamoeba aestuarina, Strain SoJaBio B1-5/56/2" /LENGTH=488 /DNA_ID=CAMNT_0047909235 /DNA_START=122 /DNA_END=1585 /DNA_ORIENTATION=-
MTLGGKVVAFLSGIAGEGDGKIVPNRAGEAMKRIRAKMQPKNEDPKVVDKEFLGLMEESSPFYKQLAIECVTKHVTVSIFTYSNRYVDLPTLGALCQYTGGEVYQYRQWFGERKKVAEYLFQRDLKRELTRETGYEAVLRFRASGGVRVKKHYGNFFAKRTDLLALPSIDADKSVVALFQFPDNIKRENIYVQSALLYSSTEGTRMIRVATQCFPVVKRVEDVVGYANVPAVVSLIARCAAEVACTQGLSAGREEILKRTAAVFRAWKSSTGAASATPPPVIQNLPLLSHALRKSRALCPAPYMSIDERYVEISHLRHRSAAALVSTLTPKLYNLLTATSPSPSSPSSSPPLPASLPLSFSSILPSAVYFLDCGMDYCLLLVGPEAPPLFIKKVLGGQSFAEIDVSQTSLPTPDSSSGPAHDVHKFVEGIRSQHARKPPVIIITNDERKKDFFNSFLVNDNSIERGEGLSSFGGRLEAMAAEKVKSGW